MSSVAQELHQFPDPDLGQPTAERIRLVIGGSCGALPTTFVDIFHCVYICTMIKKGVL